MSIEHNYNLVARTRRVVQGAGITEREQDFVLALPCMIQPLDESFSEDNEGQFGKDFLMLCGAADLRENDKVIVGSMEYKVVGVEYLDYPAGNAHLEARIRFFQT